MAPPATSAVASGLRTIAVATSAAASAICAFPVATMQGIAIACSSRGKVQSIGREAHIQVDDRWLRLLILREQQPGTGRRSRAQYAMAGLLAGALKPSGSSRTLVQLVRRSGQGPANA